MRDAIDRACKALFDDPELAAGNFFFKAHAAHSQREEPFLFLEVPFTTWRGESVDSFSLNSLYQATLDLAAWYKGHGVAAGSIVCLYMAEGIAPFVHALAINSIGCTPALLNSHLSTDIAAAFCKRHRFDAFVHDGTTRAGFERFSPDERPLVLAADFSEGREYTPAPAPAGWPAMRTDGDLIMICHSSGTTGVPKAVMHEHRQFFACKRDRLLEFVECEGEKLLTALPTTHACGMSFLMNATLLQVPIVVMSSQAGEAVADAIVAHRPTTVLGFAQTYSSFDTMNLPDMHFSTVRRYFCTADTAHEEHIRNALRLAPAARFIDMLGSSEMGMVQIQKVSTGDSVASARTIGTAASYSDCAALDERGERVDDGEPGYLGVRSPTLTPGYYGQRHLTELSRLNGYWLTGDVVIRKPCGNFVHLDRVVDVIDGCLGMPAYTLLLEEHLLGIEGVLDVTVFGVTRGPVREQAIVALVQAREGVTLQAERLLHHLAQTYPLHGRTAELPHYAACVAVLAGGQTPPEGATGKVLKRVLRESFWDWQREFDEGCRDVVASLAWNHQLERPAVSHGRPRSVQDVIALS